MHHIEQSAASVVGQTDRQTVFQARLVSPVRLTLQWLQVHIQNIIPDNARKRAVKVHLDTQNRFGRSRGRKKVSAKISVLMLKFFRALRTRKSAF